MKLYMEINPENLIDSVVAVTSLCENNSSHIEMTLYFDNCTEFEIDKFKQSIKRYENMTLIIADQKHLSTYSILFPSCMIINGAIEEIYHNIEFSNGVKSFWDYGVNAPHAHDNGLSYEDFKSGHTIIFYPEDKPYHCSNIHYDLEKIWWEYARKTPLITEIKKEFLENSLSDTSLELYAKKLVQENKDLSKAVDDLKAKIEQLT